MVNYPYKWYDRQTRINLVVASAEDIDQTPLPRISFSLSRRAGQPNPMLALLRFAKCAVRQEGHNDQDEHAEQPVAQYGKNKLFCRLLCGHPKRAVTVPNRGENTPVNWRGAGLSPWTSSPGGGSRTDQTIPLRHRSAIGNGIRVVSAWASNSNRRFGSRWAAHT